MIFFEFVSTYCFSQYIHHAGSACNSFLLISQSPALRRVYKIKNGKKSVCGKQNELSPFFNQPAFTTDKTKDARISNRK
jgi:hypothetical protein